MFLSKDVYRDTYRMVSNVSRYISYRDVGISLQPYLYPSLDGVIGPRMSMCNLEKVSDTGIGVRGAILGRWGFLIRWQVSHDRI